MQKNVLVTGAAGFIGFHLSRKLKERAENVMGLDNYNDYYSPLLKRKRTQELEKLGIKIVEGDLENLPLLEKIVKDHQITHIAHLAAQAGVRYSITNPKAYLKSNLEGFLNILEVCRKNSSIKLVYASSSSVYGLNEKIPFAETDRTDNQVSFYGATKKANELMAYTYHHLYGICATGLRFFTVYGPWGRPDMAYFSFTDAIMKGKAIDLFNHGKLKRDFTYIDDIIEGTIAALDLGAPLEIFNLGHHHPIELKRFIKIIEEAVGKKAILNSIDMQPGDVLSTYADISHSQKILNFHPKTPLEEGIPRFVEWYKTYYQL